MVKIVILRGGNSRYIDEMLKKKSEITMLAQVNTAHWHKIREQHEGRRKPVGSLNIFL